MGLACREGQITAATKQITRIDGPEKRIAHTERPSNWSRQISAKREADTYEYNRQATGLIGRGNKIK